MLSDDFETVRSALLSRYHAHQCGHALAALSRIEERSLPELPKPYYAKWTCIISNGSSFAEVEAETPLDAFKQAAKFHAPLSAIAAIGEKG